MTTPAPGLDPRPGEREVSVGAGARSGSPEPARSPRPARPPELARLQRRTLALLFTTQILGGVGVSVGATVGALLAADLGGTGVSGLASSAAVVGGALLAIPATRLMRTGGRRPGLVFGYLLGTVGALVTVSGAKADQLALVFLGMFLFGGGTTANLQARYTAVDLAEPARRGRQLALVVWATTLGAVVGPGLAPVADRTVARLGLDLPEYAGPFVFSMVAFAVAGVLIQVVLRPDPLLTARAQAAPAVVARLAGGTMRDGWRAIADSPAAQLGIAAVAVGHLVMVGVMSMTPVHIGESGHEHLAVLRVVGIVLTVHIAGMYALSPVMGWLTDRIGRRPVIMIGVGLLVGACLVAGTAGQDTARLALGLGLLGTGWLATMVAGSTLLSESVEVTVRPAAQGLSDLVMGFAGAGAAALSGLVVHFGGYSTLTLLAGLAALPLLALAAFRPRTLEKAFA